MGSDSYDDETKDILNITDKLPIILDSTVIDKFVQYIKNYVTDKEKFESLKAAIEPYALASKQIHLFDMLANLIPLRWYQIALNNGIPVVNLTDIYKKYSRFKNYSDYLVDSMNDVSIDLMNNMVELLSLKEWTTDYKTLKPTSEYNTLLWKCCTNLKQ
jgi:hypothetical protein